MTKKRDEAGPQSACPPPPPPSHRDDKIQVDAVHPLFKNYRLAAEEQTSTDDDLRYHCKQCCQYFDKNIRCVRKHLRSVAHRDVGRCVYCTGPVYEYFDNQVRLVYHSCAEFRHSLPPT